MNTSQRVKTVVVAALVTLAATSAQAAATYCSAVGGNAAGLSVNDMKFNSVAADDCYGVVGGNPNSLIDYNNLGLTWGTFSAFAGTNHGSADFMGLHFVVAAAVGSSAGSWVLTVTDTNGSAPLNLPTTLDFVGVLKGATSDALYFFDDRTVAAGANPGTFTITFTNGGTNNPGLSHLDVLIRQGTTTSSGGGTSGNMPEPQSSALALLGLGMLGTAMWARRRSQRR